MKIIKVLLKFALHAYNQRDFKGGDEALETVQLLRRQMHAEHHKAHPKKKKVTEADKRRAIAQIGEVKRKAIDSISKGGQ